MKAQYEKERNKRYLACFFLIIAILYAAIDHLHFKQIFMTQEIVRIDNNIISQEAQVTIDSISLSSNVQDEIKIELEQKLPEH